MFLSLGLLASSDYFLFFVFTLNSHIYYPFYLCTTFHYSSPCRSSKHNNSMLETEILRLSTF